MYPWSIAGGQRLICCDRATDRPYYYCSFIWDNKFRFNFLFLLLLWACKMDRIEEKRMLLYVLFIWWSLPSISPGSGMKCWHLSFAMSHRMQYGVDKSMLWWWGFSSDGDMILRKAISYNDSIYFWFNQCPWLRRMFAMTLSKIQIKMFCHGMDHSFPSMA